MINVFIPEELLRLEINFTQRISNKKFVKSALNLKLV